MASDAWTGEIPIWVDGALKWMTGLTRRTTCDDVIYALLHSRGEVETQSADSYAVFERWREVERPLQGRTKIVKVWVSWGAEQPNVHLLVRRLDDYFLPPDYRASRRRRRRASRHRNNHQSACRCSGRPQCLQCNKLRVLEQLIRHVVEQEHRLQELQQRMEETDILIGEHETRLHQTRMRQNGMDYLQDSYLHHSATDTSSSSSEDSLDSFLLSVDESSLEEYLSLSERFHEVTQQLAYAEHKACALARQLQSATSERSASATLDVKGQPRGPEAELEALQIQLTRAVAIRVLQQHQEAEIAREVSFWEAQLVEKRKHLLRLTEQLAGAASSDSRASRDTPICYTLQPEFQPKALSPSEPHLHDYAQPGEHRAVVRLEQSAPVDSSHRSGEFSKPVPAFPSGKQTFNISDWQRATSRNEQAKDVNIVDSFHPAPSTQAYQQHTRPPRSKVPVRKILYIDANNEDFSNWEPAGMNSPGSKDDSGLSTSDSSTENGVHGFEVCNGSSRTNSETTLVHTKNSSPIVRNSFEFTTNGHAGYSPFHVNSSSLKASYSAEKLRDLDLSAVSYDLRSSNYGLQGSKHDATIRDQIMLVSTENPSTPEESPPLDDSADSIPAILSYSTMPDLPWTNHKRAPKSSYDKRKILSNLNEFIPLFQDSIPRLALGQEALLHRTVKSVRFSDKMTSYTWLEDGDSNSDDTGLSSMHSDDAAVLETLV